MEKSKANGHEVEKCIVVQHLPRLNAFVNSDAQTNNNYTNGTNGIKKDDKVKKDLPEVMYYLFLTLL
jgi:hypothetical protein